MKNDSNRVLVTGGAGFLGSHLCQRLLKDGHEVICADSYYTGSSLNVEHLIANPSFTLLEHDIVNPLVEVVDEIYSLACPASPVHYQTDPIYTLKTCVLGTINMLERTIEYFEQIIWKSALRPIGDNPSANRTQSVASRV